MKVNRSINRKKAIVAEAHSAMNNLNEGNNTNVHNSALSYPMLDKIQGTERNGKIGNEEEPKEKIRSYRLSWILVHCRSWPFDELFFCAS